MNKTPANPLVTVSSRMDGNAFSIIGTISKKLKAEGFKQEAKDFQDRAFASGSYDELLRLSMTYAEFV